MQQSLGFPVATGETVEIVLPFLPKSKNVLERMPDLHRRGYRAKWRRWLDQEISKLGLRGLQKVRVEIELVYPTQRRRDWQNVAYPLIHDLADSLVRCGVIPDDTPAHFETGLNSGVMFTVDTNSLIPAERRQHTRIRITPKEY